MVLFILLLSPVVFAAEPTGHGQVSSDQFKESSRCSTCHGITHSQWDGSMHSNAYIDPFYQKEYQVASEDTNGKTDKYCLRCHTPIGVASGEAPGEELSDVSREGVQCDFCHSVSGNAGIGTSSAPFILSPGEIQRGPLKESESTYHDTKYSILHTKSEFCGMCHYVKNSNGVLVDDTYKVWKNSSYSSEGTQCQDCHMSPGITNFEINPGRSATGAPKRDHISLHYFAGANAFVTDILDEETHRKRAIERLGKATTMELKSPVNASKNETVNVEVAITNSGAGHKIPTGVSEIRQMWTRISVTDGNGNRIYHTGLMDKQGNIESGTHIFNMVLGNSKGKQTLKFWNAETILSDDRIPPEETVVQKHNFSIPADVEYPITVNAKLQYRSAPQDVIDRLFGRGTHKVPVVTMNEKTSLIRDPNASRGSSVTPGFGVDVLILIFSILVVILYYRNHKKRE
ncbi:multiheme c-type cytochrome [Methanohalobium evestigatum]|uniref:multiheme c-type cytochrome n=1 Tax=Methanohalobium evestigatum TaxID=2322 RepID=UPI0012F6A19C|nr:multiheme c-type cytochrome [Methanohalobium evestigatum]